MNYYLQSFETPEVKKELLNSYLNIVAKNPNLAENREQRVEIWANLQETAKEILKTSELSPQIRKQLENIVAGKLLFTKPSQNIIDFVTSYKENEKYPSDPDLINYLL